MSFRGFGGPGTSKDDPDVKRMLAFQAGEAGAFDELLRAHFKKVMNFIYRYVHDAALAEDLTQEVFIRIYKAAPEYCPRARFQTWMFTIARNIALNALRRNKYDGGSLDWAADGGHGPGARQWEDRDTPSPSEALLQEEKARLVQAALAELPENQRAAVFLRRFENMAYEEIARTLGVSVQAVKSLLNRAKETLKVRLASLR